MKNKIGWCNLTWNPVWGCRNHCEYCYARMIARRFWKQMWEIELNHYWKKHPTWAWTGEHLFGMKDFEPTFLEAQYEKRLPKKSQRIFVGSMSEIYYWGDKWMEKVLGKINQYPQHIFQFLTKFPQVYSNYIFPKNCWLGVTITENPKDKERGRWGFWQFKQDNKNNLKFVCFEPLLMDMELIYYLNLEDIDWVIIGAETGNRKGKIIPKQEWIDNIANHCRDKGISLYMKNSLKDIYSKRFYPDKIKEFPKGERDEFI